MDHEKIKILRSKIDIGLQDAVKLLQEYPDLEGALDHWNSLQEIDLQKESNRKYEDISEVWMFDDKHCENMEQADREYLKPLTARYATRLWNLYVSDTQRHLMLVKEDSDWNIRDKVATRYNWAKDWEADNHDALLVSISPLLDWELDDHVFFFWGRGSGLETTWELLCKYWISFLYEDEMNIVINPNSQQVLILGVHGYTALARRVA